MTSATTRRSRGRPNVDGALRPLLASVRSGDDQRETALIEDAYEVARDAHRDQVRRSGDPYIAHPLGVAMILSDLGLDDITLAGALLHDAVEDTSVTLDDLKVRFGPDVAAIVDGVTKLDRLEFDSREEQQAATMRKMLVAMAKDVRVLLIKLADRLHNMRTIASKAAKSTPSWNTTRHEGDPSAEAESCARRLGAAAARRPVPVASSQGRHRADRAGVLCRTRRAPGSGSPFG